MISSIIHQQPLIDVFEANVIGFEAYKGVEYWLYDNNTFHVVVKSGERVTMDIVNRGYDFLNRHGGGRFYNIYQFHSFSDIDPEIRSWSAQKSGNHYTFVDAIVISSLPQKILADFYLRFNKPVKPTKVFTDVNEAAIWVDSQRSTSNF